MLKLRILKKFFFLKREKPVNSTTKMQIIQLHKDDSALIESANIFIFFN